MHDNSLHGTTLDTLQYDSVTLAIDCFLILQHHRGFTISVFICLSSENKRIYASQWILSQNLGENN